VSNSESEDHAETHTKTDVNRQSGSDAKENGYG